MDKGQRSVSHIINERDVLEGNKFFIDNFYDWGRIIYVRLRDRRAA